jgi:hypothetical protein
MEAQGFERDGKTILAKLFRVQVGKIKECLSFELFWIRMLARVSYRRKSARSSSVWKIPSHKSTEMVHIHAGIFGKRKYITLARNRYLG